MSNNIDQLFKKAMLEQQAQPPDYVWLNIEQKLDERDNKRFLWWFRSIAAVVLLVISVSMWLLHPSEEVTIPEVARMTNIENAEYLLLKTITPIPTKTVFTECGNEFANEKIQNGEKQDIPLLARNKLELVTVLPSVNTEVTSGRINTRVVLKNDFIRQDFIPLTSKDALKNQQKYLSLLQEENVPEKTKEKLKIALSGHFAPGYSSGNYSSSVKNTQGYSYQTEQMDGMMNAGGGLALAVHTGKRLSLQTGVFYSRMGQKTNESGSSLRTASLSAPDGSRRVTTPLGNIKTKHKAVGYRSSEAIVLNSMAANGEETLEQVFGTLSIPLLLRCKLNDNKVSFSLVGGISSNFIVNNKVYLRNGKDKELLGSTENIRDFNISTDWGLGMEYPVSRKIRIMIEPGFKYYLQSLSQDSDIDYKPYLFTLSTGIGIEF